MKVTFDEIRLTLEVDQALHVGGIVDPRVGGVFADERVSGIHRLVHGVGLVVGVDQVQPRLTCLVAERKPGLQRLERLDGFGETLVLQTLAGLLVEDIGP